MNDEIGICRDCCNFGIYYHVQGGIWVDVFSCVLAQREGYMERCDYYTSTDEVDEDDRWI